MYCSRCGTQNDDASKFCRSCGLDLSHTTPIAAVRDQQVDVTELDLVREQLKDEYEIVDELGRGGMAIVFKAREKQLGRDVAIKVLPFSLAFDKEFVERFQREARTSAKLEHPSIIPIYRVGKSGRVIYFVMKFLRGKPLSSVLAARSTLPPAEIRQILVQVARALAYAHKSGIVHRDIKPDNIMFDEHGLAVVTDFGIAKAASGGKLTGTGMSIGTPHYMSPEQARAQALDGRSDIYSLGVVAYQSLIGRVPFDGEDSFSIGYKHIMEEIPTPPLETYDQRTTFEIVKKMMAKSPTNGFRARTIWCRRWRRAGASPLSGSRPPPPKPSPRSRASGWPPPPPHPCRACPASPGPRSITSARSPRGSPCGWWSWRSAWARPPCMPTRRDCCSSRTPRRETPRRPLQGTRSPSACCPTRAPRRRPTATRWGPRRTQPARVRFHPARPGASRSKGCLRAPALRSTGCRFEAHSRTCLPVRTRSPYAPAGSPPTTDWWSSSPEHHPPCDSSCSPSRFRARTARQVRAISTAPPTIKTTSASTRDRCRCLPRGSRCPRTRPSSPARPSCSSSCRR